ncbi:MAG: histidine kinase [Chitinophagaceae bacterium]|nr:histidine kinase [Chitinophagaceae bacterium]
MNRNRLTIYTHVGGWLLFAFLITSFLNNVRGDGSWMQIILSVPFLIFILFYMGVFYLNLYVLMPYLVLKKHYLVYTLIAIALFAGCFYARPFEQLIRRARENAMMQMHPHNVADRMFPLRPGFQGNNRPTPPPGAFMNRPAMLQKQFRIDLLSLILFLMAMAAGAMLVLAKQWRITERNKALVEIQKVKAELAFLKVQVSPHFLFNTLNNIYALAITKNENTASGILRLSNIMRYVTDEAKEDFVPIVKEIGCINDFIELQKLRLSKNSTLDYSVTGKYGNVKIAPLILMAFIENVFKHGISNHTSTKASIAIHVNEKGISLKTRNAVIRKNDNRDGIGLINVKQRLELLYPGLHKLQISEDNGIFTVILELGNAQP